MAPRHAKPKAATPTEAEPEAPDDQEAEAPSGFEHRSIRARFGRKE